MNQNPFEEASEEAIQEYFRMQLQQQKARKRFYIAALLLMIFIPFLVAAYNNFVKFEKMRTEQDRMDEQTVLVKETIQKIHETNGIVFTNHQAKIYMQDLYNGKYSQKLTPNLLDYNREYQCMGYVLVLENNNQYSVDTTHYCQMVE